MAEAHSTDQKMMARVLKGQEHLTIEQQLRNVCESFEIVQNDNVRLYALADKQDDEIERLDADAACERAEKESLKLEVERLRARVQELGVILSAWGISGWESPADVDGDRNG